MRRRALLRAVAGTTGGAGTTLLASCASSRSPDRPSRISTTTAEPPELITDCRALPDPLAEPTRERAREFVAAFEGARVHNWLVAQHGGPDDCRSDGPRVQAEASGTGGASELTVEPASTAVTAETEHGVYVVSSCSGEARYWCPDEGRSCGGASTNAFFVTHFVGDERHVRVPDNWVACEVREAPYRSPDDAENVPVPDGEPALTFRVYDVRTGEERRSVDVTLTHLGSGDELLAETYEPPFGPTVVSNVTRRAGRYRLVAESAADRVDHEFSVTGRTDPAWFGTCVYLGPDGTLTVADVATGGELAPTAGSCYRRPARRGDER